MGRGGGATAGGVVLPAYAELQSPQSPRVVAQPGVTVSEYSNARSLFTPVIIGCGVMEQR